MEILSDATFKGNVSISGGDFSVTRKGESSPLLETINSSTGYGFKVYTSEYIKGHLRVDGNTVFEGGVYTNYIQLGSESISSWSDLNSKLSFAPSSLSSTVSTLCTKVNSLCTTVSCLASLPKYGKITLCFDVPADCTKFVMPGGPFYCSSSFGEIHPEYMFMTKGGKDKYDPMSVVNVDLESRCDSTGSTGGVRIFVTKSSGFCMNASDNYVLKYFYISDKSTNGC